MAMSRAQNGAKTFEEIARTRSYVESILDLQETTRSDLIKWRHVKLRLMQKEPAC
jgi:hypothetical protein